MRNRGEIQAQEKQFLCISIAQLLKNIDKFNNKSNLYKYYYKDEIMKAFISFQVHDINTFAMEEHERRVRERNEAIDMYQAEVKRVIAAILESKQDVQKFVKSLPKFKR